MTEPSPDPPRPLRTWKVVRPDGAEQIVQGHYTRSHPETGTIEIVKVVPNHHMVAFAINPAPGTSIEDVTDTVTP